VENLRWILIAAGVAILVLLYFSGRQRSSAGNGRQRRYLDSGRDAGYERGFELEDMGIGPEGGTAAGIRDRQAGRRTGDVDPLLGNQPLAGPYPGFDDVDPDDFVRPAGSVQPGPGVRGQDRSQDRGSDRAAGPGVGRVPAPDYEYEFEDLDALDTTGPVSSGFSSFAQKIEAFSERLSPKRRKLVAQSEPEDLDEESARDPRYASKIVTLHVVAPNSSLLSGEHLLAVFERRGYHYGELNIFHSMHEGSTVFSVARMVEPGFFDIDDMDSFQTPGITLILQLPGPVPADVAFEVLVSEAFEIARELGASVQDEHHSTLTKQTVQHLREGIYEYMHRQKYFGTVSS
jgi:cell division protein ZipA